MRVYEVIGETLKRLGVDTVFGLIGSGIFGIVSHMTEKCGVTHHASRHEEAAIAMADGYAQVTGKVGVCTVHQGPGLTNTLTALTESVKNRTPVLLLAGDTATTALYQNLDVDQDAVVSSVGAGVERIGACAATQSGFWKLKPLSSTTSSSAPRTGTWTGISNKKTALRYRA